MLRPATPLSILFFVAFVLLLLSTLSTPIIRAIPLASFEGVNYGVFGACTATKCSKIQVGYNPNRLFSTNEDDQFSLPGNTRAALSAILIVHPIAALLTLICFGLSVAAHFHAPAHSPRYLLALLILSFPTLLITLLAFLVDILLFVPHMQWGGWIVLAATILIVASGVVTCAMRRTLVSRKARKKRIAENAEMNGTSYYQNRDQEIQGPEVEQPQYERAESPPPIGDDTKFAQFSSYETASNSAFAKETDTEPLTGHAPSLQANGIERDRSDPYGQQLPHGMGRRPSRDQFGNPLPPAAVAAAEGLPPPGLRQHNSRGSMNSQGSGRSYRSNGSRGPPPGYAGYPARGRGGMGPPRGNYGPRGGYGPQRGGYGPPRGGFGPPRGNYGPPRGNMGPYRGGPQGMRGPPPPGWSGPPDGRSSPGMGVPAAMMVDGIQRDAATRSRPPQNHMDQYYDGQPMPPPGGSSSRHASPAPHPDQVGQAIEMDERVGHAPYNLRDSDSDVAGMLALQQGRSSPGPMANGMSALKSPTSVYSDPRSSAAQ
ncbi:hypothetical protein ANO11243_058680 [Dothideomycetidae sp. 11243]|nr:hypothetical protein ANO11243_058680 [fungal sp. No.11243]